jgi:ankyrin repeat protein
MGVKGIFQCYPEVEVGWRNSTWFNSTPLHAACSHGCEEIVQVLITHPLVNVNLPNSLGTTSFGLACYLGQAGVVRVLLEDGRVDINKTNVYGNTPAYLATLGGFTLVIKMMIGSGREVDFELKGGDATSQRNSPLEIAVYNGKHEVAELLRQFFRHPSRVRATLREELNFTGKMIHDWCCFNQLKQTK